MAEPRKNPPPEELASLMQRIDTWRTTRAVFGPMPEDLWASAVALARMYGICRIARTFGLDYKSLRTRVEKAMEMPGLVSPTFVELPATVIPDGNVSSAAPGATIEISSPNGSHMRIQIEAGRGMETARIVAAFLGSQR